MKNFFAVVLLLPFFVFADLPSSVDDILSSSNYTCTVHVQYWANSSTLNMSNYSVSDVNTVLYHVLTSSKGFGVWYSGSTLRSPNRTSGFVSGSLSSYYDYPVEIHVGSDQYNISLFSIKGFPEFITCVVSALSSGFQSDSIVSLGGGRYNVKGGLFLYDVLTGTNTVFRQSVVSSLSSLSTILSDFRSDVIDFGSLNYDILDTLNKLDKSYSYVHYFDVMPFTNSLSFALSNGYISQSQHDIWQREYSALSSDPVSQEQYARSIQSYLDSSRRYQDNVLAAINNPDTSDYGRRLNEGLNDSINAGFSGAAYFHGATTNMLQRITNNTEQIKKELQATHDDTTNRLERQLDGIKKIRDNTGDAAAGVAHIVNDGVKINGPVQFVLGTDFLGVELNAGDITELIQGFADGSDAAMQKWLREWDQFKDSQLPYMARFSSFIESNTNILSSIDSKLDFGFTNIFDTIYFALTNLDLAASTNSYLLLSDYADYINSSGLSDLLAVLDDDSYNALKNELNSLGADDVSSGYGRWWRYYTGLSTIQANSVFKIANLLIDHEKLLKDLKRENTDVVELSDANVFSELLSKIPSQTHIDNKISELTNSIDSSGFVRIRELIPDLTNRLSVASALYDHDFALPSDISWVLIPGDSDLNIRERVIHISPSDHYRVFQLLHYGIAFSYCLVNLILLPKFLLLLVRLFDRVWNKSERLIYNSTQS